MTTLSERIQEIISAGYTQADLHRAAKVTKGTSNQWLDGKIKSIKLEYAQGIEALTNFRAVWIVTGKGPKKVTGGSDQASHQPRTNQEPAIYQVQPNLSKDVPSSELIELVILYVQLTPKKRGKILDSMRGTPKSTRGKRNT